MLIKGPARRTATDSDPIVILENMYEHSSDDWSPDASALPSPISPTLRVSWPGLADHVSLYRSQILMAICNTSRSPPATRPTFR